jgi:hypothetical protein
MALFSFDVRDSMRPSLGLMFGRNQTSKTKHRTERRSHRITNIEISTQKPPLDSSDSDQIYLRK